MIPKNFIHDLLNRLDIVDVIERYVPLKKAGANYIACCPFHNEKSPSFTVSQNKQFYHCFGCGAHGTAIGFVMEHGGLGFVDAVEELARSAGVTVPREAPTPEQAQQHKVTPDLYEVMQSATRYYRDQLKQSAPAIDYLKRRGLSGEIALRFGIGYSPEGWQNLGSVFANYQDTSLLETGLVIENEDGKRYDRFRDRIMFPIVNARGQVIGFGGRVLDSGEPKYLNSPETVLFEKGRELYGLFQALKAIRTKRQVLVVEGYMDVVALAQHGIEYAVATLGTATTPYHVQKLLRLTDKVMFCFDGDAAGQRAAWRAMENALPQFSYVLRESSTQVDLRTQEGRTTLLQRAKPLLTVISAPTTALLLRKEVAALAGITQAELEALYAIKPIGASPRRALQKAARPVVSNLRVLLRCILFQPDLARELPEHWMPVGAEAAAIIALTEWSRMQEGPVSSAAMIQNFQGTVYESLLAAEQAEIMQWGETFNVVAEFQDVLARLRNEQRNQQLQVLHAKMHDTGMKGLGEQERSLYLQLLQRSELK
ncbi:MAG: DNA primase [Proteobacteria bacterium]|nr:DNA primase [Pseudomonadota bacterium]